jgi:hypothetical protein
MHTQTSCTCCHFSLAQYVVEVFNKPAGERYMGAFYNGSGALLLNQVIAIAVIIGWTGEKEALQEQGVGLSLCVESSEKFQL